MVPICGISMVQIPSFLRTSPLAGALTALKKFSSLGEEGGEGTQI
jgi:hypothetical protein